MYRNLFYGVCFSRHFNLAFKLCIIVRLAHVILSGWDMEYVIPGEEERIVNLLVIELYL